MLEVQQSIVNDLYAGDSHSQWVDDHSADGVYSKKRYLFRMNIEVGIYSIMFLGFAIMR